MRRHAGDPSADEELIVMERTQVASGSPYEETVGFSRAVRVGAHAYVAGTAPVWPDGEVDPDPAAQARRCWEIALDALARVGGEVRHVVRTRQFLTPAADPDAVGVVHGEVFGAVRPASTMLMVAGLLDARWVVEVELDAVIDPD
jgi:enamine deaminase RidA (YjgF/YER057c/UK114 family)